MPALVAGTHVLRNRSAQKGVDTRHKAGHDGGAFAATAYHLKMHKGGWVYIMTNRRNGTLYLGVTSNLAQRAWQH